MAHRDVHTALYGVVAGVILGASSLAFVQAPIQASVQGDVVAVRLHEATKREIERRGVQRQPKTHTYPTVKSSESSVSSEEAVQETTTCSSVIKAVETIWNAYNAVIPQSIKYTEIRQKMDAAFAQALDECMPKAEAASSSQVSVSSAAAVDNDCEKYGARTSRYKECVISEQTGKKYP